MTGKPFPPSRNTIVTVAFVSGLIGPLLILCCCNFLRLLSYHTIPCSPSRTFQVQIQNPLGSLVTIVSSVASHCIFLTPHVRLFRNTLQVLSPLRVFHLSGDIVDNISVSFPAASAAVERCIRSLADRRTI